MTNEYKKAPPCSGGATETTITENYTPMPANLQVKIFDGITKLEIAVEAYDVLSDAVESEFNYVPNNPAEEILLNRLDMYFSAFSLFQEKLQGALDELQSSKHEFLRMKAGD